MNDPAIRALLLPQLTGYRAHIEELPLGNVIGAMTRADVVGLTAEHLHGFEIKGDSDSLRRVPMQLGCYERVCSAISFVVAERFVTRLMELVPAWVGIGQATAAELSRVRPALAHGQQTKTGLAELLWQEEVIALLKTHQVPVRSRWRVWECREALEACPAVDVSAVEAYVSECLWRRLPGRLRRRDAAQMRRAG